MVAIEWIDLIYEKKDLRKQEKCIVLQAYDDNGLLIFEKEIEGTLEDAEKTIDKFKNGMINAELYDYSK